MKKFLAFSCLVLLFAMLIIPASALSFSELGDYGQNTYKIYEATTKPVVDGVVSENEYGEPFQVITDVLDSTVSYYSLDDSLDAAAALHTSFTAYMTYDNTNLYIALVVKDASHSTPLEGTGVWDGDYTEIDFMPVNQALDKVSNRTRYALGLSDAGNVCGYYANTPDFVTASTYAENEEIPAGSYNTVTRKGDITTYEACLPWADILGEKPAESFLNYIQLGVAHKDMNDLSDYEAYLGAWRNIYKLSDEDIKDIAAKTGIAADSLDKRSFNVIVLAGKTPADTDKPADTTKPTDTNPPADSDKPAELPADCAALREVGKATTAPTIDGKITGAEWGDAEFVLNAEITEQKRTYCRDWFSGNGNLIPDTKYNWSYDKDYFYLAIDMTVPSYSTDALIGEGLDEYLTVTVGDLSMKLIIANGAMTGLADGVKGALVVKDANRSYEFAIPRDLIGGDEFKGNVYHEANVHYKRVADGTTGAALVATRSTPEFSEQKTNDLFVLTDKTAGTNAGADSGSDSPATFDAFVIVAVVAAASAAGVVVSKKRR